ncbi:ATP-binding protein [Thermodesulfobacteriota bacterium]
MQELQSLQRILEHFSDSYGLPERCKFQLNLVLEEIFTNITTYGFSDAGEHFIQVNLSCDAGILTVCVEDDGRPFNPVALKAPDLKCRLEDREIGGLGIHLVKKLASDINYERRGNKNVLTLTITLS